jgi:3-dehydroquinate synthase
MAVVRDVLTVNLGERSYPIVFGSDLAGEVRAAVEALAAAGRRIAVLTDRNVAALQGGALEACFGAAPRLVVEPGEETKSVAEFGRVLDFLAAQGLSRSDALVAAGGGVVGDLGGFAAASYLRGIDLYQVPTTLLAMVDSSVGGKTGVNLPAGKNLAGAFHQPRGVFVSTRFLDTLPPREFAAGMAEVIKGGLLGDASLFESIERSPLTPASSGLAAAIRTCCAIKARFVEADERETAPDGGRALLNLGHTFGHAIEQVSGYGAYLHGEAVAIGLCAAARLSQGLGYLAPADVSRVKAALEAHFLPVRLRKALPPAALVAAMGRDKKVRQGTLRFVVMRRLGEAAVRADVPPALVAESLREIGAEG